MQAIYRYAEAACRRRRLPSDFVEDCYSDGVVEYLLCLKQFDPARSGDPQKFARTRASYAVKRSARKEALNRKREVSNHGYDEGSEEAD